MAPTYTYLIFTIPDKTINHSNNIRLPSILSPGFQERAPFKTNTIEQTCTHNIWSGVGRCQPGLLFLLIKVLLEHSHTHSFTSVLSYTCSVVTESIWLTKSPRCTTWSFMKKLANSCDSLSCFWPLILFSGHR